MSESDEKLATLVSVKSLTTPEFLRKARLEGVDQSVSLKTELPLIKRLQEYDCFLNKE